jgi:hypothetical protein
VFDVCDYDIPLWRKTVRNGVRSFDFQTITECCRKSPQSIGVSAGPWNMVGPARWVQSSPDSFFENGETPAAKGDCDAFGFLLV